MKNYIKPEIKTVNYSASSNIASGLSTWLETNEATFDAAITTFAYEYES